jgi:alkylhydroperoxidase family enzyme
MPRISRLNRSEVSPELRSVYDQFLRDRGNVPYFFRTLAHRPEIFRTATAHMEAVLKTGTLPTRLKELVVVRTSEHIDALNHWRESPLFSEAEKEALHLAERMTLESRAYSDEEMARLRRFYSEGEVVELMAAIGLFNYFNRFNNVLQMEPTQAATVEELAEAGVEPVSA